MWQFFENNSAAIQALAAVFGFIASVAILIATIVYVLYTKTVAEFTREQARLSAEVSKAQQRAAELSAVCQYFQQGDTPAQQEVRSRIWLDPIHRNDASQVASYWHFWGLMVERGLLPFWVFEGSSGVRVVQYYSRLETFIKDIQEHENKHYAEHFTRLRDRILNSQKSTAPQDLKPNPGFERTCSGIKPLSAAQTNR